MFVHDELLQQRRLELSLCPTVSQLTTDRSLLLRVLSNMTRNALEASPEGSEVQVRVVHEGDRVEFQVWNPGEIPRAIAGRVFQRSFTTKPGPGRGLGAYIMKLFGERCLGGELSFTTGSEGTTFRLSLPLAKRRAASSTA
jgi:signal transduction histidine kinase